MQRPFLDALAEKILLADGAMGTELFSRGISRDRCPYELNLSAPELVAAIHESYLNAGAQVIETNTFGANPISLARYGLEKEAREINLKGVAIARQGSQGRAYVAGSVGPVGRETASSSDIYAALASQIEALTDGGVDLVILETFSDLEEAELGCRAARAVTELPLVLQFSFHALQSGTGPPPEQAANRAQDRGVDVVGANCGSGPEQTLEAIQRMAKVSSIRLSAMPSAGLPEIVEGQRLYPISSGSMASYARRLVEAGVAMVGGCCGTTPAMIQEMKSQIEK